MAARDDTSRDAATDDVRDDDTAEVEETGADETGSGETGSGETGSGEVDDTDEQRSAPTPPRSRRTAPLAVVRAAVVLAVVLGLVTVGVLVWTFTTRTWEIGGREIAGQQDEVQGERDELMELGRQFMLRSGTYGPDGLDAEGRLADYRRLVTEVITPTFANTFDTDAGLAEQIVAQTQVSRSARVFGTGVDEIDDDRATVLVAGSIQDTYPEAEQAQEPFPFRVRVEMVRIEGEWLVDDFSGVNAPVEEEPQLDPDLDLPGEEPEQGGQGGGGQGGGDR